MAERVVTCRPLVLQGQKPAIRITVSVGESSKSTDVTRALTPSDVDGYVEALTVALHEDAERLHAAAKDDVKSLSAAVKDIAKHLPDGAGGDE